MSRRRGSQPTRAAWIEICCPPPLMRQLASQPTRAAWIEILKLRDINNIERSQPTRAAWIEILTICRQQRRYTVAAHSGCVD